MRWDDARTEGGQHAAGAGGWRHRLRAAPQPGLSEALVVTAPLSPGGGRMVKAAVEAGERKSGRSTSVARVGSNLASPQTSARRRAEVRSVHVPCFLFLSFHSDAIGERGCTRSNSSRSAWSNLLA